MRQCAELKLIISIHALLAESDRKLQSVFPLADGISIHALLAESDLIRNSPLTKSR